MANCGGSHKARGRLKECNTVERTQQDKTNNTTQHGNIYHGNEVAKRRAVKKGKRE